MFVNILIITLTIVAVLATLMFSIWTYIDTKRKYSHEQFIEERKQDHIDAREHFRKRTSLGKKND